MRSEWVQTTIGAITDSCLGKMLDAKKNKGEYKPYLANVNVRWGSFDLSDLREMRFEDEEEERYGVKNGDLIMCEGGEPGRCALWMRDDYSIRVQKALHRIRAKEGTSISFLYYWFLYAGRLGMLESYFTGTTIKHLPGDKLRSISLLIPTYEEQCRIAEILYSLDRKIEGNNLVNDNLLQQAMAIFNDRYDSAEEQCPFTSLIHVLGGGTPKTGNPEFWNGDIPFFTPKDVGSPYTFQTEKTITPTGLEHCNSRLYPKNTSFVTARGTVGKVSLAGKPMAMNQSCYALASDSIDPILVYFYTLRAVDSLKHKASGAVFDAIVTRDFETEVVSVIPETESKAILSLIAPMLEGIHTNTEESIRLAALRDALLPRLMSGEIDVSSVNL